jgi:hypothetical protein
VTTIDIELFDKQLDFIEKQGKKLLFEGGIGAGKTQVGALYLAMKLHQYKNSKWIMAARDAGQLKTATDDVFEYVLTQWMGYKRDVHYAKVSSPFIHYVFKTSGSQVFGFGAHNYDSVFRGGNYNGGWGDEVDFWKPEAYRAFKGRIRRDPAEMFFTSSPKGYNHIWQDFWEKDNGVNVVTATSFDNPTLPQSYFDELKASYSPSLYEQEVMARRLNLNVGKVYSEFRREKHVEECRSRLRDDEPIYFFTDYNIAHYCGVYIVPRNTRVLVIGEEHLQYKNTEDMAEAIKARWPKRRIIVCGDSAGNNKKDTAAKRTNYQIFKDYGLLVQDFRNPLVQARIISANSNFYHNKITIDPSCTNTIRDLELVSWKPKGNEVDKSDITLTHASDALTYGMWHFHAVQKPRKSRTIQL